MPENQEKPTVIKIPNKNSMRNMRQYKDLSDAEFDDLYQKVIIGVEKDDLLVERQRRLMQQFEDEYDLTELLPNDRMVLRSLVSAITQLEDYESDLRSVRKDGINQSNILLVRELNNACGSLRKDISSMQDDLKITRKTRKSDREQTVLSFVEELKTKAKTFAHMKMHYIYCEKCGQLLATAWWQTDAKGNDIRVECKRKAEDGTVCGWSKRITAKELIELDGSNRPELLPESMK